MLLKCNDEETSIYIWGEWFLYSTKSKYQHEKFSFFCNENYM